METISGTPAAEDAAETPAAAAMTSTLPGALNTGMGNSEALDAEMGTSGTPAAEDAAAAPLRVAEMVYTPSPLHQVIWRTSSYLSDLPERSTRLNSGLMLSQADLDRLTANLR